MRIARVADSSGQVHLARITGGDGVGAGDTAVPIATEATGPGRDVLRDALADGLDLAGTSTVAPAGPVADGGYRLLSPVAAPSKVIAIGLNYADHARETGQDLPKAPITFVKTNNSICGPGDPITYSKADSTQVDYEAELAVVIGRGGSNIAAAEALDHVLGYTLCNDVSARDAQFADGQWIRGKSFDTFCPLGPWIVTADEIPDPQQLPIRCRVNGETLQESNTSEMIFGVAEIISYLSRVMTWEPGDVIATGTTFGVGFARTPPIFLLDGDVVDIEVDGIGTLTNPVRVTP